MTVALETNPQQTLTPVKIDGANYSAIDSGDGYFVFRDVPIFSEVPKGEKNAPEDIGKEWLEKQLARAMSAYQKGRYTSPIHIGHNKVFELTDPAFAGYFLPKRVGRYNFADGEKWALFSDLKITESAFGKAAKGELPYLSAEVDWEQGDITSLAFLNSKPPHFQFALFTVGAVVKDSNARFEANVIKNAKFQDFDPEKEKKGGDDKKDGEKKGFPKKDKDDGEDADMHGKNCCAHCSAYGEAIKRLSGLMGLNVDKEGNMAEQDQRATPNPAEPNEKKEKGAQMEADPKAAAKFALYEDRIASLEKREKDREEDGKAKQLAEKAIAELKGYQLGEKAKAGIEKFAKQGEAALKEFVETIKEGYQKEPPRTVEEFMHSAIPASDPALSKFQKSPDDLERAQRALAEYRQLKNSPFGKGMASTEEQYVKFRMVELSK